MGIKEIKELEDEVREVGVADVVEGEAWGEKDFIDEDEEEEEEEVEEFSIGDTMLARGGAKETWNKSASLEDEVDWEEERELGGEFEEEDTEGDFGGEGFSYEDIGSAGGGDLYGAGTSGTGGNDLYGAAGASGGSDLYGATGAIGSDSVGLYNTQGNRGGAGGEGNMYVTPSGAKKGGMGTMYAVEGRGTGDGSRRQKKSGLESGMKMPKAPRQRKSRGVSIL